MIESISRGRTALWLTVLVLLVLLRDALLLRMSWPENLGRITIDDTYYYFNTAWNQTRLGFTTFDGVNQTNGVQFLWYWMLVALGAICSTKQTFLYAGLSLCGILSAAAVPVAYAMGRRATSRRVGGWVTAIAVASLAASGNLYVRGLENSLHLLVFAGVGLAYFRFMRGAVEQAPGTPWRWLALALMLTLNGMSRLDASLLSAMIFAVAGWQLVRADWLRKRTRAALLLSGAAIAILGATTMFFIYERMGGSPVPVSGLWKSGDITVRNPLLGLWGEEVDDWKEDANEFRNVFGRGMDEVSPVELWADKSGQDIVTWLVLGIGLFGGSLALGFKRDERKAIRWALFGFAGAILIHQAFIVASLESEAVRGVWYQSPYFLLLALLLAEIVCGIPDRWEWHPRGHRVSLSQVIAGVLMVALLGGGFVETRRYIRGLRKKPQLFEVRMDIVDWVKNNLPKDARLAAFNAGQVGFFSDRSTTNLDGLINSYDFYRYCQAGGSLIDYVKGQHIGYFVDYETPAPVYKNGVVLYRKKVDEEGWLSVVRID